MNQPSSKLQALHIAFNEKDDAGEYKCWSTTALLMRLSEYQMSSSPNTLLSLVSVLCDSTGRFKMRIVETAPGFWQYRPLPILEGLSNVDKVALLIKLMQEIGIYDTWMMSDKEMAHKVDLIAEDFMRGRNKFTVVLTNFGNTVGDPVNTLEEAKALAVKNGFEATIYQGGDFILGYSPISGFKGLE